MARSNDDDDDQFDSPDFEPRASKPRRRKSTIERVKTKVMAPAICLIIVGSLGLLFSIGSFVFALASGPAVVDPNASEFVQNFQRGQSGPFAATVQAVFVVVNTVIIVGAVQMMQFHSRVFAILVSVMAIMNIGTCCCLLGAPVGIWSLIVLLSNDVVEAFEVAAA